MVVVGARQLGDLVQGISRQGYRVDRKADQSLVTTADREANAAFINMVSSYFPDDGVLGEEASRPGRGSRTWVIDPLDGTTEFLRRIPVWMIAIALVEDGVARLGVAYNPSTREMYYATAGSPACRDGTPIRVSTRDGHAEPVLLCGTGRDREPGALSGTVLQGTLEPQLKLREYGGLPAVFAGCKVAEGVLDGFLCDYDGAHDLAATSVIIERAGGTMTSRTGAPQPMDRPVNGGIGSNGLIHSRLARAWSTTG